MRLFLSSRGARAIALTFVTACVALASANASPGSASLFGRNLVLNGDAEAGRGAPDASSTARPLPGWNATGNFTAAQYGGSGGLPAKTDPGPPKRGKNFFAGGPSNASSSAEQMIDVSAGATAIDAGGVKYKLSGYLGGFSNQEDHTVVSATFLDASGQKLGVAAIGPVTPANRRNVTGLLLRGTSGTVPANTRSIDVVITATRFAGAYNDGYSDNILLYLTK
jgi:hypothetical protein